MHRPQKDPTMCLERSPRYTCYSATVPKIPFTESVAVDEGAVIVENYRMCECVNVLMCYSIYELKYVLVD